MKPFVLALLAAAFLIPASVRGADPEPAKPAVKTDVSAKKQAAAKKAPEKKAPEKKKKAPGKGAAKKPAIKTYPANAAPPLRDKDGNVIPTNPEAYDVSSALPKKK